MSRNGSQSAARLLRNQAERAVLSLVSSFCSASSNPGGNLGASQSSLYVVLRRIAKLRQLIALLRRLLDTPNLNGGQLDFIEAQLTRLLQTQVCAALDSSLGSLRKTQAANQLPTLKTRTQGQVRGALNSVPSVRVNLGRGTNLLAAQRQAAQTVDTVRSLGTAATDLGQVTSDLTALQDLIRARRAAL